MKLVARRSNQLQWECRTMLDDLVPASTRAAVLVAGLTRSPGWLLRVRSGDPTIPIRYILQCWEDR